VPAHANKLTIEDIDGNLNEVPIGNLEVKNTFSRQ
jgi:hypothetical protein